MLNNLHASKQTYKLSKELQLFQGGKIVNKGPTSFFKHFILKFKSDLKTPNLIDLFIL